MRDTETSLKVEITIIKGGVLENEDIAIGFQLFSMQVCFYKLNFLKLIYAHAVGYTHKVHIFNIRLVLLLGVNIPRLKSILHNKPFLCQGFNSLK